MKRRRKISKLAKLTAGQVVAIRKLHDKGWTQPALAEKFEVSQVSISNLLRGRTYRGVAA
jgi:plasmid maintenance system antidote protein VapI